jgi:hypothetical protein
MYCLLSQYVGAWSSLYETWYVYHGTWAHLSSVFHKFLPLVCMYIPHLTSLGNGSVNTLLRQRIRATKSKSKLCCDRRSAGQSLLEQSTHLGLTTRSWLLSDSCGFIDLGRSLWRENGSAVCNCYWPSPAQSFSGPNPVGLVVSVRPVSYRRKVGDYFIQGLLVYCSTLNF